ncbi:MAG: bifunctional nicotinamidase/pyrazinamidase [Gammaproteobacteria bacterium]|nr:bifunctional nicotinamidase/pyrazinamidase [Gammaproteobacteria bacterium]
MKALLIIDVQNDFMPQGALAVAGADTIVPVINQIQSYFPLVVATQDWHPPHHQSFASTHPGHDVFTNIQIQDKTQTLWPDHCIQGTEGAAFDPALNMDKVEAIFRKGTDIDKDSYSAFYDNHHQKNTGLAGFLQARGVRELYFSGLCADICVYYSILDAIQAQFTCTVIEDATQALDHEQFQTIQLELIQKKVMFVSSEQITGSRGQAAGRG